MDLNQGAHLLVNSINLSKLSSFNNDFAQCLFGGGALKAKMSDFRFSRGSFFGS